jgi:hypothetical protein
MAYKLYTDRNENFECEVNVKNASLKGSIARLIVEADNLNLVFKGKIENGKCIVPVRRLRGLIDECCRGNMHLEIIVEDTYFRPWESDYVVEEHTSVKVKVNEQKQPSNRPIVEVNHPLSRFLDGSPKTKPLPKAKVRGINLFTPLSEISMICNRFGIRKSNIITKKKNLVQILREYFRSNQEYKNQQQEIVRRIGTFLM